MVDGFNCLPLYLTGALSADTSMAEVLKCGETVDICSTSENFYFCRKF